MEKDKWLSFSASFIGFQSFQATHLCLLNSTIVQKNSMDASKYFTFSPISSLWKLFQPLQNRKLGFLCHRRHMLLQKDFAC